MLVEFKDAHLQFDKMAAWWNMRDCPVPEKVHLPKTGFLVYLDREPVCGGFLFQTDSDVAIIGHIVSNPTTSSRKRHEGLNALIRRLEVAAETLGFSLVGASANYMPLIERYQDLGYTVFDKDLVSVGKLLGGG